MSEQYFLKLRVDDDLLFVCVVIIQTGKQEVERRGQCEVWCCWVRLYGQNV